LSQVIVHSKKERRSDMEAASDSYYSAVFESVKDLEILPKAFRFKVIDQVYAQMMLNEMYIVYFVVRDGQKLDRKSVSLAHVNVQVEGESFTVPLDSKLDLADSHLVELCFLTFIMGKMTEVKSVFRG